MDDGFLSDSVNFRINFPKVNIGVKLCFLTHINAVCLAPFIAHLCGNVCVLAVGG